MKPTDVKVGATDSDKDLTLADLAREIEQFSAKGRDGYVERARMAEAHLHGSADHDLSMVRRDEKSKAWAPRRNYFRGLIATWAARQNEDRQLPWVWAKKPVADRIAVAEACNALLKHARDINDFNVRAWDWSVTTMCHGAVGVIPYFSETSGPEVYAPATETIGGVEVPLRDEDGNEMEEFVGNEGEVIWREFAPGDYDYGPNAEDRTLRHQDWLRARTFVSIADAKSMLRDQGIKDMEPTTSPVDKDQVEVWDYWHRPNKRIPDGFRATVVGEVVVSSGPWDLPFRQIPLAQWGLDRVRGTRYFTTPAHDAIHLQRLIDMKEEAKLSHVKTTGHPTLLGPQELIDAFESNTGGPRYVALTNFNEVAQGSRWLNPPEPAEMVFGTQQDDIAGMHDVMGLNEIQTGRESAKAGTSARQIAYLNYLDGQKQSGGVRSREAFDERLAWLTLELYREYTPVSRRLALYGPGRSYQEVAFRAADLEHGYDISFENVSGQSTMHSQIAADVKADMQAGGGNLIEGMERSATGLGESTGSAEERSRIENLGQAASRGQQVQPDPTVRPFVALEVLRSMAASGSQGLEQLIQYYTQAQAQAGQAGPGPGQPQPPAGGPPGGPQ